LWGVEVGLCLGALELAGAIPVAYRVANSGTAQLVLALTLVVAGPLLLLGGPAMRTEIQQIGDNIRRVLRSTWFLPVHLAGFVGLLGLTVLVAQAELPSEWDLSFYWLPAMWALLGALTLVFWVAVGVPERLWRWLMHSGLDVLLAGAALAVPAAFL